MSQSERNASNTLCKYYLNGVCRKGSSCNFSHNRGDGASKVCTFYLEGACSFGAKCRYDHVKIKNTKSLDTMKQPEINEPTTSGMQSPCGTLQYKGQEFKPGRPWVPPASATYSEAIQSGLQETGQVANGQPFICDYCSQEIYPDDDDHLENCVNFQESEMELAFKAQSSSSKTCGICLEVVWDKTPDHKKRFGVLSHCDHVYCLECIRTWRCKEIPEGETARLCPECRKKSDYVIPSYYWYADVTEKEKLIADYKESLKKKPCKYFSDNSFCQFGERCFYLHLNPDGTKGHNRRRYKENANGLVDLIKLISLSEFLEERLQLAAYDDDDDSDSLSDS